MSEIFLQLTIVLGFSVVLATIVSRLKQPLLIGYILAGIFIGAYLFNLVDFNTLEAFAHIGIALLLFIAGLNLKPQNLQQYGKVALLTGGGQIIFTSLFGIILARLLGFNIVTSLYLATAFTFSSTIIIVRLLHEKRHQDTLYGKIALGFLIIQDLAALLILAVLSSLKVGVPIGILGTILFIIFKLIIVILVAIFLIKYLVPRIDQKIAQKTEILFLFSLFICFGMGLIFKIMNFSVELGALMAGIILASSPYQKEIAARISPLRDFFIIMFFIILGSQINFTYSSQYLLPIIVFSLFILLGNPLILMIIMKALGYSKKTGFFTGLTVAQISEFSLILVSFGVANNHLKEEILDITTLVGLITIAISSYIILNAEKLYKFFKPLLNIFENKGFHKEEMAKYPRGDKEIILFGSHRLGEGLINSFKKIKASFLVVDYDPLVVKKLSEKGVDVQFGEAGDPVLLDSLPLEEAKIIISTVPDFETNLFLIEHIMSKKLSPAFICIANYVYEAERLYQAGANYVIMPYYLGRRSIAEFVLSHGLDVKKYLREKNKHLKELKQFA